MSTTVAIRKVVMSENNDIAARLRHRWDEAGTTVVNLISSPGSGKTRLLERLVPKLQQSHSVLVLAADCQTENDAERIRAAAGSCALPIVTHGRCHLDARFVEEALVNAPTPNPDFLIIENVGNLVCPSNWDLGEHQKIVLVSVTEGEDKPLKYPGIFTRSRLMVVTKTDLVPYCDVDIDTLIANAHTVNPKIDIVQTSGRTGAGIDGVVDHLHALKAMTRERSIAP